MDSSQQNGLLLVLVGVTAIGFVLQGIALWSLASRLKAAIVRGQKTVDEIERRAHQLMEQAGSLVDALKPLKESARTVSDNVEQIMAITRRRADQIDVFLGDVTETLRSQADKLDDAVTDTVKKFEETTATIQRDILLPVMEISSLVKGVRTGLDYLFSRKRERQPEAIPEDEEMFI